MTTTTTVAAVENTATTPSSSLLGEKDDNDCSSRSTATLLETTADICQQLAVRLKKHNQRQTATKASGPNVPNGEKTEPSLEERHKMETKLLEENIRLRAAMQDVTEANKRWQKYNHERQTYMHKLMETIRDLRFQVHKEKASAAVADETAPPPLPSSSTLNPPQPQDDTSESGFEANVELKLKYDRLVRELEESRRKVVYYLNRIEKQAADHKEHVEILEMQVRAHRDDWEAEQREKKEILERESRAQAELRDLKMKIKPLERELNHREFTCSCRGRADGLHTEPIMGFSRRKYDVVAAPSAAYNIPPDSNLIPRGGSQQHTERTSPRALRLMYLDDDDTLVVDSGSKANSSVVQPLSPSSNGEQTNCHSDTSPKKVGANDFYCPECGAVFPPGRHFDFLQHFESCQGIKKVGTSEVH